jgi:hypothetical protein
VLDEQACRRAKGRRKVKVEEAGVLIKFNVQTETISVLFCTSLTQNNLEAWLKEYGMRARICDTDVLEAEIVFDTFK